MIYKLFVEFKIMFRVKSSKFAKILQFSPFVGVFQTTPYVDKFVRYLKCYFCEECTASKEINVKIQNCKVLLNTIFTLFLKLIVIRCSFCYCKDLIKNTVCNQLSKRNQSNRKLPFV